MKDKKLKISVGEESSKKMELNRTDWKKIGKGAGIAVGGALLTYAAEVIPGVDFGEYNLVIAPVLMVLINLGLKWYSGAK